MNRTAPLGACRARGLPIPRLPAQLGLTLLGATLLGLSLGGCTLIDQRSFGAPPPPRPVAVTGTIAPAAAALPVDPRVALVGIGYATPDPVYRPMLDYAVRAALRRDPGVAFDVVAVAPAAPAATPTHATPSHATPSHATPAPSTPPQGAADAASVMRAIMALGVPPGRIHLSLATDPKVTMREVRVYVR